MTNDITPYDPERETRDQYTARAIAALDAITDLLISTPVDDRRRRDAVRVRSGAIVDAVIHAPSPAMTQSYMEAFARWRDTTLSEMQKEIDHVEQQLRDNEEKVRRLAAERALDRARQLAAAVKRAQEDDHA